VWGSLLAVLNAHLYRQHLNIIKKIWLPKLRHRTLQLTFPQVLVQICFTSTSLGIHWNTFSKRRNQAKQMQKPTQMQNWTKAPAGEAPKPNHQLTRARRWPLGWPRVRLHPRCGCTAPSATLAHLALVVHLMLGRRLHVAPSKNTPKPTSSHTIKEELHLTSKGIIHIWEEEGLHTFH
jgi:hypothetical protein